MIYYVSLVCYHFLQVAEKAKYIVLSFLVYGADPWALSFIMCIMFIATYCELLRKLNFLCWVSVCGIASFYP